MTASLQIDLTTNTHPFPAQNRTFFPENFLGSKKGIHWSSSTNIWRKAVSLEIDPGSFFTDMSSKTLQDQNRSYSSSPSLELTNMSWDKFLAATSFPMLIPPLDLNEGLPEAPPRASSASSGFSDESPLPASQSISAMQVELNSRNSFKPISSR